MRGCNKYISTLSALDHAVIIHRLLCASIGWYVHFIFLEILFISLSFLIFLLLSYLYSSQCSFISYFTSEQTIQSTRHYLTHTNSVFEKEKNCIHSFNYHVGSDNAQTEMHIK